MTEVKSTTDYKIFGQITSNREVDKKHVKKLIKNISENNLLHLNPIIVNGNMEVIDGQHRLEAAQILGVPVFYFMDENVDKTHISKLNSVKKDWKPIDYINYFTIEKKPGFDKLSAFITKHPLFPVSTCLMLLSSSGYKHTSELRGGVCRCRQLRAGLPVRRYY